MTQTVSPEQVAQVVLACWVATFVAVACGNFVGSLLRECVFLFVLRRLKTWRRFHRAMRKVYS